ncbi:MAG: alcohol dehydrogenase catalytic domain-containing protein [Lachnospiraceae bacterium]|nr:alcohol dehydrogenase catalytic domain-containing protein [Lachnospiraceae bacterium]
MKSVIIERKGKVIFRESAKPVLPKGFALVRVKASAVCATDLEVIDGNIAANYPLIPGHEWSGIVEETENPDDRHWIGKRVVGSNDVVCLKCDACRRGQWRYCKQFEEIGFKRNGAYAEYVAVPAYGLCEIPDNVSFLQAALAEPLGVALGAMKKSRARMGQTCLIIGAGSIGLCTLAVARVMGLSKITVCNYSPPRLEFAKKLGAYQTVSTKESDLEEEMKKIHPEGTEIIIDATGSEECIQKSLRIAKKGGTVVLAGYGGGKDMNIRMDDIHLKTLHLIGAGNNWDMHKKAIELMSEKAVDLEPLITHVMPLERYEEALDLARKRPEGFVKAVFQL